MGHHHDHDHSHTEGNIKAAFFLNLSFTIIEIIGGFYVNSVAILSDALHDLGDSLSLGLSWYFQRLSSKGRDDTFSYGYKRFSVLGAIINSIVLVVGSVFILLETIPRLIDPVQPDAKGMIVLAILGVVFNGAAVLKLKKGNSINEKVVSLHLLEDLLGWVAVLVGSLIMLFATLPIIDPLLSIGIALFILFNVYKNLKTSFKIILQAKPIGMEEDTLKEKIMTVPEILDVHDLHTWSMDGNYHITSLHIVLKSSLSTDNQSDIKNKVRKILKECSIDHATIEIDYEEQPCELEDC